VHVISSFPIFSTFSTKNINASDIFHITFVFFAIRDT
jgi:hypothetical protein